jgi:hypothetical protein
MYSGGGLSALHWSLSMTVLARSVFSDEADSLDAGRAAGEALLAQFAPERLKAALVYCTMNHDHAAALEGLRAALGEGVQLFGCSVQGVVSNEHLTEDGFALGVMGFGGRDLEVGIALEREIQNDGKEKGRRFGQALKRNLGAEPKVVVLLYDPLCRADVQAILEGVTLEIDCPLVGGADGQPWGHPQGTFQYWDREVLSHGLVGIALGGPFDFEIGLCHGTTPSGLVSVITKADGNQILEMDGRPAGDVWRETTGCGPEDLLHQSHFATWALGFEVKGPGGRVERVIRGAFGIDSRSDAIILQAAVPTGTRVMLHHRTVEKILAGTEAMAADLTDRLNGRAPWAVLGFECAARTFPFLGQANTYKEHELLRAAVAPESPWLGMMAWGEIGPCAGMTVFHNYTYPVLVLTAAAT